MRIAILSYHTCPLATLGGKDTGGMNVYVRELTCHLGKMGISADVYTRSQDEHVPHVIHDLGYGNRVVHIPAGPELPLPKNELVDHLDSFAEGIRSFAASKSLKYDLIHSHYWMSGIIARELKSTWNIPVVHMFHTLGLMKNRIAREGEHEGDYRVRGERDVLKIADKVVVSTVAELSQLQWLYEVKTDRVVIVPPGVDLSHFYPIPADEAKEFIGMEPDRDLILFVGRIEPLKGIDTLIRAVSQMQEVGVLDDHDLSLWIIGGIADDSEETMSNEVNRLQNLCDQLGLKDFIKFLGKRSQDSLPYYYSAAHIVVVPSHYESFGMVALEAMACGTPVVASQVGGLAYLVQDGVTGYHVPDQDPEALSKRLTTLLEDRELNLQMGSEGVEVAKDYGWGSIALKIKDVFEEVIRENPEGQGEISEGGL
ncbi:MAG: glycosyltransferase family 1 protein [Chloroflexi bacterium]|nr:glycosyltransferase family 1 protein [Chloroflexota bacterium]